MCTERVDVEVIMKNELLLIELIDAIICSSGAAIIESTSINCNLCHISFSLVSKEATLLNRDATGNIAQAREGWISFLPRQSPGRRKILTVDCDQLGLVDAIVGGS